MELEELKHIWKQQKPSPNMELSKKELLILLNNKMISFDKEIRSRDRIELIVGLIVAVVFTFYFFMSPSIWIKTGSAVIVLSSFFIIYWLKTGQPKRIKEPSYNHSINQHLKLEFYNVQTQKKMLENIIWWYIGPLSIGLILVSFGFPLTHQLISITVIITVDIGIWYLNQKTVARRLDPLITSIKEALDYLQSEQK